MRRNGPSCDFAWRNVNLPVKKGPHPDPLPEYRERGKEGTSRGGKGCRSETSNGFGVTTMKRSGLVMVAAAGLLLGAATSGCSSNSKEPTPKEKVVQQWNATRAAVMYGLAKQQFDATDFEKARQTTDDGLKMDPKNVPLLILSAKIDIEQGQLDRAERTLDKSRELNPKNAEADYLSGVIYQRWQRPEIALKFYTEACAKSPNELSYVLARAEMQVTTGKPEVALAGLQEKVIYFESSGTIRDAVGELLLQQKRYNEAVDMLRQASILSPDDAGVREHLGLAQFYARQWRDAKETLARITATDKGKSRADLWEALGECQMQLNQARDAKSSFETASQLNPASGAIWLSLGKAALQLGDAKRAEICVKKSLALEPESAQSCLLIGYIRLKQKKLDEALGAFSKASKLDPKDSVSVCMIGLTYSKLGMPSQATQYYARALKMNPKDELATSLMARVDVNQ